MTWGEEAWSAIPYPAVIVDGRGQIVMANDESEAFFSMSEKMMKKRRAEVHLGADSKLSHALINAADGQQMTLHLESASWGEHICGEARYHLSPMNDGAVLLLVHPRGMVEQTDQGRAQASAARSVSGMAAMLAHEIRNPLAGIIGAAQLLEMGLPEDDAGLANLIEQEAGRIGRLVDRMESFAGGVAVEMEPVNIHDVLDRAKMMAEAGFAKHCRFVLDYDPSLPEARSHSDQLLQILQNLIKNAAEAMEPGGTITLKTAYRTGMRVMRDGSSQAVPLEISVLDDGPMIPDEVMSTMFDPFITTKQAGSGLGLSLVSKLVSDHGGRIEAETKPGATAFRVLLPVWTGR
ncbi:two-component system sensor histidine kinase NtrB [Paracoccaceae bacterium GXU_MW_L88]